MLTHSPIKLVSPHFDNPSYSTLPPQKSSSDKAYDLFLFFVVCSKIPTSQSTRDDTRSYESALKVTANSDSKSSIWIFNKFLGQVRVNKLNNV